MRAKALRARGWNWAQWEALADDERDEILAYELWRVEQYTSLTKALTDSKTLTADAVAVIESSRFD